jgi:hypothetical protein
VGNTLYIIGTLLQLAAFAYGVTPAVLGVALMVYGAGLAFVARAWRA